MKVGSYEIPEYRLFPTMVDATRIVFDKFKGESAPDNVTVATLWGHKSVSGSVLSKLGALRSYGLIEKRGIKVTELGKNITYPTNDDEKNEAIKQAILNIPLWAELYRKFGVNLPKENFWVDLKQLTGIEAPDSQKLAESVRNFYIDDVKNLNIVDKPAQSADPKQTQMRPGVEEDRKPSMNVQQSNIPHTGGVAVIQFPQIGELKGVIRNKKSLDIIRNFLDEIEEFYKTEESRNGEKPKESE
jgi:hypothetical protein